MAVLRLYALNALSFLEGFDGRVRVINPPFSLVPSRISSHHVERDLGLSSIYITHDVLYEIQ